MVCREGVGLIDMSSFAKFNLAGDKYHLIKYLQKMCSNDIDIPVGGIIATGMLNEFGTRLLGFISQAFLDTLSRQRNFGKIELLHIQN